MFFKSKWDIIIEICHFLSIRCDPTTIQKTCNNKLVQQQIQLASYKKILKIILKK